VAPLRHRSRDAEQIPLTVAFDAGVPQGRWGPLFHVFRLERRAVQLRWRPVGFPAPGHSRLDGADVGLFLQPPYEPGTRTLTLDAGPMAVVMAAGHLLAPFDELRVADVLDETFPGSANPHPEWDAFWSLDAQRGAPARRTGDAVHNIEQALGVVACGRAIVTLPACVADGLEHPGLVALPLLDGPAVRTRLVWRSGDVDPAVAALADLAAAWTRFGRVDARRRSGSS
jgi:DNA-binding transcriptional LysR family regulator